VGGEDAQPPQREVETFSHRGLELRSYRTHPEGRKPKKNGGSWGGKRVSEGKKKPLLVILRNLRVSAVRRRAKGGVRREYQEGGEGGHICKEVKRGTKPAAWKVIENLLLSEARKKDYGSEGVRKEGNAEK